MNQEEVIIDIAVEEKMGEVLNFLSELHSEELIGTSLEQYAATETTDNEGNVVSVQFDLYFIKFVT